MILFFVLLLLIIQVAFLVGARSMAIGAIEASSRRVAAGAPPGSEEERVVTELETSVPGMRVRSIAVSSDVSGVEVAVVVDWTPPGPDLLPVSFDLRSRRVRAVPP